ncbi:hypothetical protein V1477_019379 [Vespula maculifrons]|uniref:Uncharacterized protein n=1 Tax=Vespula maculifrons TaxID=7453 RepID=A0ABD2ASD4_VESMC
MACSHEQPPFHEATIDAKSILNRPCKNDWSNVFNILACKSWTDEIDKIEYLNLFDSHRNLFCQSNRIGGKIEVDAKNGESDTKMEGAVWAKFYNKFSTDGNGRHDNSFNETESSCSWQRAEFLLLNKLISLNRVLAMTSYKTSERVVNSMISYDIKFKYDLTYQEYEVQNISSDSQRRFRAFLSVLTISDHYISEVFNIFIKCNYCKTCESWTDMINMAEYLQRFNSHRNYCSANHR